MNYLLIDPVAFDLGFVKIYWYGIMYIIAFVLAYFLAKIRYKNNSNWTNKEIDDLFFYCCLGVVLGGRIGYLIFYNIENFLNNPLSLFDLQNGGMSFHGGLIGVILAVLFFNLKKQKFFFEITDFIAPLAPIGLACGRFGNYINSELWGKTTTSILGVYAPNEIGQWAIRHPTQLYEAFLEGIILFIILWFYTKKPRKIMTASAIFLILYGCFRFIIEFLRLPDAEIGYIAFGWLTMGQLLSIPMIVFGFYLFYIIIYFNNETIPKTTKNG